MIRLRGGRLYDPHNGIDGRVRDLYMDAGRIVAPPRGGNAAASGEYDLRGRVVMPGGIDIHTHIGGGKMALGRLLLPEDQRRHPLRRGRRTHAGGGMAAPTAAAIGYRYAQMGYTSCFEPAMLPSNARQVHLEFADIPLLDKGSYVLLGNDDFLLRMLRAGGEPQSVRDYVAWMLQATRSIAVKAVNPGGIHAFKFNQRRLDLDEPNRRYGLTPRRILLALARAVRELGLHHPLHLHGCNLGAPGSEETTLRTIAAAEGLPLHLTHLQFHSYGTEGDRGFSSGAARLAEAINGQPNISVDVGQAMFGQTLTASGDTMRQYAGHRHAHPRRWACADIECDAGCGVMPFRYRDSSYVNALQWAIGLELFLLVSDPWRIFLTTDHPNGAPFSSYPRLIRLLMDRGFRNDCLAAIHPEAARASHLGAISREYSLYEIAIITRAGPARSLGLSERGHLGVGAVADIAVYRPQRDAERMFASPEYVFKDGRPIVRRGQVLDAAPRGGRVLCVRPEYDPGIRRRVASYFRRYHTMRLENFPLGDELPQEYAYAPLRRRS